MLKFAENAKEKIKDKVDHNPIANRLHPGGLHKSQSTSPEARRATAMERLQRMKVAAKEKGAGLGVAIYASVAIALVVIFVPSILSPKRTLFAAFATGRCW